MTIPILNPKPTRWWCPSCGLKKTITHHRVETPMHQCDATGLDHPLTVWTPTESPRQRLVVREDYVGDEQGIRYVDGKPIMGISTDHADGSNDLAVFAPAARGEIR